MMNLSKENILSFTNKNLLSIVEKTLSFQRISKEEALTLYENADVGLLGAIANVINFHKNQNVVVFNRNIHIEPTNICIYNCKFCSFSANHGRPSWILSDDEIYQIVQSVKDEVTEVHIVGGVYQEKTIYDYANLLKQIKIIAPNIHLKAFTAVELDYMSHKSSLNVSEGLALLQQSGLDSIPGGGAEIFEPTVREKICGNKSTAKTWLDIHKTAHQLNIPSNATMLYGHIEKLEHRIDHLNQLRLLQDETNGFQAFIPLKFKNQHNQLENIQEANIIDDFKTFAISRIYLDNIKNIKAYWPMLGKSISQLLLSYGVNDLDGTINDSTKIYSMAGAKEKNPSMSVVEISQMIIQANKMPKERDSLYQFI
ncbi:MAG: CofH family radical SAM protein [Bacteroidota bacterium]